MKEYKGLYHDEKKDIVSFEHGAHFKYLDLYNALMNLQSKNSSRNDLQYLETDYSQNLNGNNNDILLFKPKSKKKKKIKLKERNNDNNRYHDNDYPNYDDEINKNSNNAINIRGSFTHKRKDIKIPNTFVSRSVDRSKNKLPTILQNSIGNNNLASLNSNKEDDDFKIEDEINRIANSKTMKIKNINLHKNRKSNKGDLLPIISSFNYNKNTNEEGNILDESKSRIKDNQIIKRFQNHAVTKINNKNNYKFLLNDMYGSNLEDQKSKIMPNIKIRSIFDTEKQIKNHKLLNRINNNYHNNYVETINNDLSKQIYQLKKQLLGKSIKNSNLI